MRKGHKRFYEILKELEETHDLKNNDYSKATDPLSNLRNTEAIGLPAYIGNYGRMGDKWERFTNFIEKEVQAFKNNSINTGLAVKQEKIQDTLKDLAVYCILESILIEEVEAKAKIGLDKKKSSGI